MVDQIIPEFINHNEEGEAVDLLMETERLSKLAEFCNKNNYINQGHILFPKHTGKNLSTKHMNNHLL